MSQQPGTDVVTRSPEEIARITQEAQALVKLSDEQIEAISLSISQAEKLVATVLEPGIDFGIHPGTSSMALRESGGSKIANAFNCYPEHTILHIREDDEVISYLIQVKLIHRGTGRVVAIGVGACSTMETKYAYRWVDNPGEYGLDKSSLKYDNRKKKWRIPNPDTEDLGNTILKMASKRAEIDAAQSLPGVSSALKKLFMGKGRKPQDETPNWQTFWGEVSALGLSEDDVHQLLGIKSMKDWLSKGKSLNEAVQSLAEKLAKGAKPPSTQKEGSAEDAPWEELGNRGEEKPQRELESIKTGAELLRACFDDFNLQPDAVYAELNITSLTELTETPADAYNRIAAARRKA